MKLNQINKFIIPAFFLCLICAPALQAQLIKSVEAFADYSTALKGFGGSKDYIRPDLKVNDANGMGGGLKVNFNVYDNYYIGVSLGYMLFSVHQDSALDRWNWLFWDTRYKGNVKDALSSDPSLSGILNPIQKLDLVPLIITFNAEFKPAKGLTINPSLGMGVAMYTRRLYLEETWQKKFEQLNYTFGYSYRNFAPDKKGNPFTLSAGVNLAYEFLDGFKVHSEMEYMQFIKTPGTAGSGEFPMEKIINVKLGLTILY